MEDIQVLLFANDDANTFLGEVSISAFYPTEGDSHLYKFFGELPTLPTGKSIMDEDKYLNCKIMVLANCSVNPSAITETITINKLLETATFNFNGNPSTIPMWGVLKVTPSDEILMKENGFPNPLPDIYLLRAMAKVEVIMKDTKHQITSIAIENYNNTGNCVPAGYNSAIDTRKLNRNDVFRATTDIKAESCPFIANVSDVIIKENGADKNYKCYTIYVPEYKNMEGTSAVTNPSRIAIQVDDKTNKTYYVYYGTAGKNTEYNIVRNHIYRYNITKVNDGYNMELTCVVKNWDEQTESWDFTDQVTHSEGGDLVCTTEGAIATEDVTENGVTTKRPTGEIVTRGGELTFEFKLDTPLNAIWTAEFISLVGDPEPFVFMVNNSSQKTVSGTVGKAATLTIKPAETNISQNNSALLRISVKTIDGRTIVVKNLLPSAFGDINEYTITHSI